MNKQDNDNRTNEQEVDGLKETTNTEHERVRKVPDMEGVRELLEKGRPLTEQETAYAVKQINIATETRQELIVRLKALRELVMEAKAAVELEELATAVTERVRQVNVDHEELCKMMEAKGLL